MRYNCKLLMLFFTIALTAHAQQNQPPSLNPGDPVPALRVREWLKGVPVQRFEKDHIYVIEFWATWCGPCIAAMPHLSDLAREYKGKVTVIGIDILERKTTSLKKVKAFIDSMGQRMDYNVATDDNDFMLANWTKASAEEGIPVSYVVNGEGRLAWIGHPMELIEVFPKIVSNSLDVKEEAAKRSFNRYLAALDHSLMDTLNTYAGNANKQEYIGKPDSALLFINELVTKEPKLKYAPIVGVNTFKYLLTTNLHKAYEFGKEWLMTPAYEEPRYQSIIYIIEWYSDKLNLPAEIYELGGETYQAKIDKHGKYGNINIPMNYNYMAVMYWRANSKVKAIEAQQKAIEALKSEKNFSKKNMAAFESRLQQYKNM